jgi:hypothetical protein
MWKMPNYLRHTAGQHLKQALEIFREIFRGQFRVPMPQISG